MEPKNVVPLYRDGNGSGRVRGDNEVQVLNRLKELATPISIFTTVDDIATTGIVEWCDLNNLAIRVDDGSIEVFVKENITKWTYKE